MLGEFEPAKRCPKISCDSSGSKKCCKFFPTKLATQGGSTMFNPRDGGLAHNSTMRLNLNSWLNPVKKMGSLIHNI
jgi:hypothetical protein